MTLRVLIVSTSAVRRGAEVEAAMISGALVRRGVQVDHVALAACDGQARIDARPLGTRPLAVGTLRALRRAARAHDVVVAYGSTALPACALALAGTGRPFVYRSIGDPAQWSGGWLHRRRTGLLFRRAAAVVALWSGGADAINRLYRVPRDRLHTLPNVRSATLLHPVSPQERCTARAALGLADGVTVVAYVGALAPEKRVDVAIDAVAALAGRAVLLVAGAGPLDTRLRAQAERVAPGRVRFLGSVDEPSTVLHAADAVVLTSRTEGMPGVAIEAGLCGLPVVATAVGATPAVVIDAVTGLLVPVGDPDATARALTEAISQRTRFGGEARAHCKARFDVERVAAQWEDLLTGVVSARARSSARRPEH